MRTQRSATARPAKRRLTQAERSDAMRKRLVDATLECLARDGYSGTTISRIVQRAKVSHGATGHHFPSKADLIIAATEQLIRSTFQLIAELLQDIADEEHRLELMLEGLWDKVNSQPPMRAFLELTVAAQRDKTLARQLRELNERTAEMFERAASFYFEPLPGTREDPHALLVLTRTLLLGLAMQYHSIADEAGVREQLAAWARIMNTQFRARRRPNSDRTAAAR